MVMLTGGILYGISSNLFRGKLLDQKPFSQQFYDRNGLLLRLTLAGDEKYRIKTELNEIDPKLIQEFMNKEDRYFYWHAGFNPISLVRAAYATYVAGDMKQGASTITMQVSRLLYPEATRSIAGKLIQIFQAAKIEWLYDKDEIISAYLNWVPYGSNIEGVGAACFFYFNKSCQKLSADEVKYLVQIPQRPQKFTRVANEKKKNIFFRSPHFVEYLLQTGIEDKKITTTLDYKLNTEVQNIAAKYFETQSSLGIRNYSVIIVDSKTNEVLTYIGSADYFNKDIKGQIDANRTLKSPGSTLKPFIYALGLQQGLIHEKSLLKDIRMSFGGLNPENFDEQFLGPLPADQALILSRNLPAFDLSMRLTHPTLYEFLNGKSSMKFRDENYYGLSLAFGGVEFSMTDLVKLYSALGQQGRYDDLNFVRKHKASFSKQILSPESAYVVMQMLKKNPRTESAAFQDLVKSNLPVAWKTGTSKSYKDAWTIGLMGNYVVGVWFGDNDKAINPALVGRNMAAPLFFQIYDLIKNSQKYNANQDSPQWMSHLGLNVKSVHICSLSKKIKTENCGHQTEASLFIPSVSPIETCQIHRKVFVDQNRMSCDEFINSKEKIVEVWPDDLLDIFRKAGLKKVALSDRKFSCDNLNGLSQALSITSPQNNIEYLIYAQKKEFKTRIQLKAVSESDSQYLDWFVDKSYIGRSFKGNPLFFEASQPGTHQVMVTDNLGRSQSSQFTVKVNSY
jgi:penicillin-binding protein 1C